MITYAFCQKCGCQLAPRDLQIDGVCLECIGYTEEARQVWRRVAARVSAEYKRIKDRRDRLSRIGIHV